MIIIVIIIIIINNGQKPDACCIRKPETNKHALQIPIAEHIISK